MFWFENNYVKLNTDKCHLLVSGTKYEHSWAKKDDDKSWESNKVKRLGLTIDTKLKIDNCKYLHQSQSKTKCIE